MYIVFGLVGTESALGGSGMNRGGDPAGARAETTAGSSSAQKIEKPQEVICFEAAKEVCARVPTKLCRKLFLETCSLLKIK